MKRIRLLSLILQDFKGMSFALTAGGDDVNVFGRNATGKTTLADAFSWLLFDKDSLGRSDFEIKNLDANGKEAHGLEHSVEGALDIDGETTVLRKVYKEVWAKKRGNVTKEMTGNTTDYFIDGVPVQKKEYTERVAEIAGDENIFRLLTSPTVFPSLHWQKQRALLLDVCGDISDADVIISNRELEPLTAILGKRSLDDHKKVITARRSEINKTLELLPARIDENRRMLPDVTGLDLPEIRAMIESRDVLLNESKLKLQGVDTGGNIAGLSKQLAVIDADLRKMESAHYNEVMKSVSSLNARINELGERIRTDDNRIRSIEADINLKTKAVYNREDQLQALREKWHAINDEKFQDTTVDTCAACGQSLPSERVEEARTKALEAFNVNKAERLEAINTKGNELKAERDRLKDEIEAAEKEKENASNNLPAYRADLESLTAERDTLRKTAEDYSTIVGRSDLIQQKTDIETEIKAEKEGRAQDTDKIKEEIKALESELSTAKADADKFARKEQGEKRITELMEQEKTLAAEFEKLEHELFLCDSFVRAKVSLLTERINSRFEITRFRLFEQQINGGISECCVCTVGGVPYDAGLNNAGRINAGIDICTTLQRHYQLSVPMFCDNAESVVELLHPDCQMIRLVVSAEDKILRVERTGDVEKWDAGSQLARA